MRETFLQFALPDVGGEELAEIKDTLESGWLTTGPKTRRFETEFSSRVGAKHAIAVSSCTAALHLALEAIGVGKDDEVVTTPYTFASTAAVVIYLGARPVFVDVEPRTLTIDPAQIERAITPRTKAIMPVHIAGLPADLDAIHEIAARHDLWVIEDAAHAFPGRYKGRPIGSMSDLTCFSFYATKTITTGEGGMICTNDDSIADRCRIMSLHGISKDAWKRYTAAGSWYYEVMAPGYKYNMTDIAAGMGLAQLRKAESMRHRRRGIAAQYTAAFDSLAELLIPCDASEHDHTWHLYMLRLHLDRLTIDRAQFIDELKRRNIGTTVNFIPLHLHPYYCDTYGYRPDDYPVAHAEYLREISLPIYSRMTDQDVTDVIAAVREITTSHRCEEMQLSAPITDHTDHRSPITDNRLLTSDS